MYNFVCSMEHKLVTLPNKLKLLIVPMPALESATVTVWVKTGSRNESDEKLGISHFLEHMAFKGGKKYPSAKAVSEAIDEIGGEFNASTSKEITQYYIRIRAKLVEKAFDVLSDIVLKPNLDQKEIEKEKGVILEEMNLYEDTPVQRIWDLFEQLVFKGSSLGRDIIGTKISVPNLKKNDFISYRNNYYHAENILITVAGGVSTNNIKDLVNKYFGEVSVRGKKTRLTDYWVEEKKLKLTSKKVEQTHLVLGFPADPLGNKDRYNDAVLNTILGSGMSSRLFSEIREKRGLAYTVRSDIERFADAGYFAVYAGVDPRNAEESIKVILDQLYGLGDEKFKITPKELDKAKEYLKGHLALGLEDTRGVNSFYGYEQLMLNKVRTAEEVFRKINDVEIKDIYISAGKIFKKGTIKLAIIGDYEKEEVFRKLLI